LDGRQTQSVSGRHLAKTRINDKLFRNGDYFNNYNQTNTDYGIDLVTRCDLRKYYYEAKNITILQKSC
jgi:hypothetical protein